MDILFLLCELLWSLCQSWFTKACTVPRISVLGIKVKILLSASFVISRFLIGQSFFPGCQCALAV